jgi:hypothetical protein
MQDKAELVITALQQRIGELASDYETKIAMLRAEITILVNEKEQREKEANEYSKEIEEKISSAND